MAWTPTPLRIAGGLYLVVAGLMLAHTTNAFVASALYAPAEQPMPPTIDPDTVVASATAQQSVDVILHSGLFELPPTPTTADGMQAVSPPPPPIDAARKVTLLGSVSGKNGGVMAVLEDTASKKQDLYRLGTHVQNVGTLAAIEKNRVLFREGTREEWLALAATDQARSGGSGAAPYQLIPPPDGPSRRTVDRREIEAALADPTRLLTHAQATPNLSNGKLDGFRLFNVIPLGFFDKLGLRSNDVLQRINGVELRDPSVALSLFQQLRNERVVRIDLMRNAHPQTLTYDIR